MADFNQFGLNLAVKKFLPELTKYLSIPYGGSKSNKNFRTRTKVSQGLGGWLHAGSQIEIRLKIIQINENKCMSVLNYVLIKFQILIWWHFFL